MYLVYCNVAKYICICHCSNSVVVVVVVLVVVYLSICLSASLKTKLFCETSSVFELDNAKNEAILRDLRLPREMHLSRSSSNVPRLPSFLKLLQNPHGLLTFDKVQNPLCPPRKTTSERPKVLRTPSVFCTFAFEMCFLPQRRALFRHVNFQKCSETISF